MRNWPFSRMAATSYLNYRNGTKSYFKELFVPLTLMKMVNVWFYKSDTDRIAAMFVIHLEGYLADSIKRQLRPLLQYPVCHYSATTLVAVGQN
ncbi:hypothetical protein FORC88_2023 [Salmonella enterica subsp. enterica serovar Typhimurium]|nr:hypothetical protein FORC88_2023 [Salmonella enterica subsp. enterica serovar Typhimurium]